VEDDLPHLEELKRRLRAEEEGYAACLGALDALSSFPLPAERLPNLPGQMERLNALWSRVPRPDGSGLGAAFRRRVFDTLAPALDRQADFNSALVQALNGHLDESARLHAHLRELTAALIRYLQRLLPVIDARDRLASTLATTRSELILEAFDRRLESLARRLEGLRALQDRLEALGEEARAVRGLLAAGAPPPAVAQAAREAADDSVYAAFENRFRGEPALLRERLASYLPLFESLAPVVDVGCGRGEFLDLLEQRGIAARGVDGNARFVAECRARGLDVSHGDLLAYLGALPEASLGGVFAAQVAEHLPPRVLMAFLEESHRVLRPGGLLVLETVNPRSLVGFLEVYNRDLTHERPLHPDTLRFLAAAAGFSEVRIELRTPVEPDARLQPVPSEGLPPRAAQALNENVERLNALLYGPQEYALLARR
jgi:SAM-dependent methyltransferase